MLILLFLSSGLFLGWSLGANNASNVFGTAVGTRMVKFRTAATICSIFVILGACISGAGATHTLGQLGAVNAMPGSFIVAFTAALAILWMTKLALPISTSQAIVGAIIGWNLFSGSLTDYNILITILGTWVVCPILAAIFSILLFQLLKLFLKHLKIHLFRMDAYTRFALIVAGAIGAYSLGANNISTVMGVFVPVFPFKPISVLGLFHLSGAQQLFLLGGIAISVGVFTYSYGVMKTIGVSIVKLNPQSAFVVVLAEALVLFLFASEGLESWLIRHGLPSIPLVPVSSSQAVVGAVLGIGLVKGARNIRWKMMYHIMIGWVATPVMAGILSYVALFFFQNVFDQQVYRPIPYILTSSAISQLPQYGISPESVQSIQKKRFKNAQQFYDALQNISGLTEKQREKLLYLAEIDNFKVVPLDQLHRFESSILTPAQLESLRKLEGRTFRHKWEFHEALKSFSKEWHYLPASKENRAYNKTIQNRLTFVYNTFRVDRK